MDETVLDQNGARARPDIASHDLLIEVFVEGAGITDTFRFDTENVNGNRVAGLCAMDPDANRRIGAFVFSRRPEICGLLQPGTRAQLSIDGKDFAKVN